VQKARSLETRAFKSLRQQRRNLSAFAVPEPVVIGTIRCASRGGRSVGYDYAGNPFVAGRRGGSSPHPFADASSEAEIMSRDYWRALLDRDLRVARSLRQSLPAIGAPGAMPQNGADDAKRAGAELE